jgi:hypothetical protein
MAVPLDIIRAFHNAFRKDIAVIDRTANDAAHGQGDLDLLLKRYKFFNDVLVWHALGEEEFVFPAMENVAPLVSEPYEQDHRGLDSLYERLDKAVAAGDLIEITRTTAVYKFHLDFHLKKEEAHLYRIFDERISMVDQITIGSKMAQKVPQEYFQPAVKWLFSLINIDDRENVIRIWQQTLPGPVFNMVAGLVRETIGGDWAALIGRIPEIDSNQQAQPRQA